MLKQSAIFALALADLALRVASAASTYTTKAQNKGQEDENRFEQVNNRSLKEDKSDQGEDEDNEDYWLEAKAIFGGVLGFWGGVGGLGAIFLIVVMSQRYCCRKGDDDKDVDGGWCLWV